MQLRSATTSSSCDDNEHPGNHHDNDNDPDYLLWWPIITRQFWSLFRSRSCHKLTSIQVSIVDTIINCPKLKSMQWTPVSRMYRSHFQWDEFEWIIVLEKRVLLSTQSLYKAVALSCAYPNCSSGCNACWFIAALLTQIMADLLQIDWENHSWFIENLLTPNNGGHSGCWVWE